MTVISGKSLNSVCLISPTCKVGLFPTYLPRRALVRIHVVTLGALNLLKEGWQKHIEFLTVLHACKDLRAKDFCIQAIATAISCTSSSGCQPHKEQLGLCHSCSLILLESKSFVERTLEIFLQIISSYKQSSFLLCIHRKIFHCLNAHWNVFLSWLGGVNLPLVDLLGGKKLRQMMETVKMEGKILDFCKKPAN